MKAQRRLCIDKNGKGIITILSDSQLVAKCIAYQVGQLIEILYLPAGDTMSTATQKRFCNAIIERRSEE